MKHLLSTLVCLLATAVASVGFGEPATHLEASADSAPAPALSWDPAWRPVDWVDLGLTLGTGVGTFMLDDYLAPGHSHWVGGVLFDDEVRGVLAADSARGRKAAAGGSDIGLYGSIAWPIVDAAVVWWVHGDLEAAAQISGITAQTMSMAAFLTEATKRIVRRRRPDAGQCRATATCSETDALASFWSGHTTMTFAAAGLVCAHHERLPIYGGGFADSAACVAAASVASLTGALRVVADRHHTTDVLVGAAFGISLGYFLPQVLHYASPFRAGGRQLLLAPYTEGDRLGMSLIGTF